MIIYRKNPLPAIYGEIPYWRRITRELADCPDDLDEIVLLKEIKIDKSVNVNTSVNQNQAVTLKLDFVLDVLKDELSNQQYKELQSIIGKEKDTQKAKVLVIEKIKEFGGNVVSNILASILTNPVIWTGITKLFEK